MQESGDVDLGVRLIPSYWGKGLGTEIIRAWIQVAFTDLRFDRLTAFAHPDNAASHRILEKCGFHLEKIGLVMGMEAISYSLDRRSYREG